MNYYYNKAETPLAFHKFLVYFSLPAAIIIALLRLFVTLGSMSNFHWLYLVDFVYFGAAIALALASWIGLAEWRSSGRSIFMAYLALNLAYRLLLILIYAVLLPAQVAQAVADFLTGVLYIIPVGIYYTKRKYLFEQRSAPAEADPEPVAIAAPNAPPEPAAPPAAAPEIRFCRHCGRELVSGSAFCSWCGTEVKRADE